MIKTLKVLKPWLDITPRKIENEENRDRFFLVWEFRLLTFSSWYRDESVDGFSIPSQMQSRFWEFEYELILAHSWDWKHWYDWYITDFVTLQSSITFALIFHLLKCSMAATMWNLFGHILSLPGPFNWPRAHSNHQHRGPFGDKVWTVIRHEQLSRAMGKQ